MSAEPNPYRSIPTLVTGVTVETPTIKTLHLRPAEPIGFLPGQFVELLLPGVGEAPFTPSSHWADRERMDISIMKAGRVTALIHELQAGDTVGVRGPFGRGYDLEEFRGREVLVVGGGCGFAPLRSLMYAFFDMSSELKKLIFCGGCRSPKELLYREELNRWASRDDLDFRLTVDQGDETWSGPVGVVTVLLDGLPLNISEARSVVCGPPIMMMYATRKLLELGFAEDAIFLSMEKNMSCGLGKCGHCRLGTYYCCVDGPVFKYSDIKDLDGLWD